MNKNKKLIIHIGLPKTATSTLQVGLFVELHKKGIINYFGRVGHKNNLYKKYIDDNNGNDANYKNLYNYLFNNELTCCTPNIIKSKISNVLSEEFLSTPEYSANKDKRSSDNLKYAKKIYQYFKKCVSNITILLTIRNQQTMIPRYFVQAYSEFTDNLELYNFNKYLEFFLSNKYLFSTWYYDKLLQSWAEVFGKENLKILLYEDFLENKEFFMQELSEIIGISKDSIKSLLEGKHFNRKDKTEQGVFVNTKNVNSIQKIIFEIYKNPLIKRMYMPIKNNWPNNFLLRNYRKISTKKVLIKKITNEEKKIIFEEFKDSNLILSSEYGINKEKLKKYGYI